MNGDNGGDDVTHSGGGTGVGTMKALHYFVALFCFDNFVDHSV